MIFSVGNIITLVVVIIILLIYRQLDKGNRSLEKVKRYVDKVREDLDRFVEEKAVSLKDLSIELDVHQQTAREVLKRIQGIEEQLSTRADDIDIMHDRIAQYDKALADLDDMTGRVDENLRRLQEESEFVDTVGRRLKESTTKIIDLEKSIPAMKEEFARQNTEQMKGVLEQAVHITKEHVSEIRRELGDADKKVNNFSDYITNLEARRDTIAAKINETIQTSFQKFTQKLQTTGASMSADMEKKLDDFGEKAHAIELEYRGHLKAAAERGKTLQDEVFNGVKDFIESKAKEVQKELLSVLGEGKKEIENTRKELVDVFADARTDSEGWKARVDKLLEENYDEFKKRYDDIALEIETKTANMIRQSEKAQQEQHEDLDQFERNTKERMHDFESLIGGRMEELESNITERERNFRHQMEETAEKVKDMAENVVERLEEHEHQMELRINESIETVEKRIADYEGDAVYKFKKLEEVNVDIEAMDKNLRQTMEIIENSLKQDYNDFGKTLEKQRQEEKTKAAKDIEAIWDSIHSLDQGLAELKTKAYENVSEKLKIFEDDFFTDLRNRSESMQKQFADWKASITKRLSDLAEENESKRGELEKQYSDKLKERLQDLQGRVFEQQDKFEGQVVGFQQSIEQRMHLSEQSLAGFEEAMKKDLNEAQENSRLFFDKEFTAHNVTVGDQLKRSERDLETRLKSMDEQFDNQKKELQSMTEAVRSDVTLWQADVLNQMKSSEADFNGYFTNFKTEVAVSIGAIKDDFNAQRDDLIIATQEERNQLKNELKSLGEQVIRLEEDLKRRTESALEQFTKDYDVFMLEFQRRTRELQTEIDGRMKDFRTAVGDTREKIDSVYKKIQGKLDENFKVMTVNLQEIDKKQKNFLSQTKLFDRADTLKDTLRHNIEDLKADIGLIDVQAREMKEAEKKFLKISKLGDEVNTKLTRFLSEKRRLEDMEGDFKKLINMSQTIDSKLEQVTLSHDALQKVQVELRTLEELREDVNQKYTRLIDKHEMVETTIKGVEKNFEQLQQLDTNLKTMQIDVSSVTERLKTVTKHIETLSGNKEKADKAVGQVEVLDNVLTDLEERMGKLQKAREWLGGVETRLREVKKDAETEVRLLGTLLKEAPKEGQQADRAPSSKERDMVIQLAHRGWTSQQIAKHTKLSRGEVELIMEILPRK